MNDKPVIQITEPEVIEKENETIYDYDKSHVIYKMQDLGSFAELQKMKAVNQKYKEVIDKAIEYINGAYEMAIYTKSVSLEEENIEDLLSILKEVE